MTRRPSRQFPRRQADLRSFCSTEKLGRLVPLRIWSLGPGGAGLEVLKGEVYVGEPMELIFSLPGEPTYLILEAEVVWIQPMLPEAGETSEVLRFGVRFDGGGAADFRALRDFAFEGGGRADSSE